ncbi:hypothetical protein [Paraburkholderia metrosideri]|uniref:Uncharacterized protein n=1 Tax=Paraburkholderia metrosideri TaxID=580937 RepID=A0ABM8NTZ8_9BURK|nr:hypothetical protein [Paraburkholderia metrosideri]CAD6543284.1 hypothetical protein LMG28140_03898 [Paraburkholderia metrosideri]
MTIDSTIGISGAAAFYGGPALTGTASLADQAAGIVVDAVNGARVAAEAVLQSAQDKAFENAMAAMAGLREFIGEPGKILGRMDTKHGEVAEHVEVAVRRSRDYLAQIMPGATFEGVGRTAPMDYRINGIDVQSKFINGANNSLKHVLEHMDTYSDFGKDGFYHIPKDQHSQILDVLKGNHGELSEKTVRAIHEKVAQIELSTGKPFTEVVQPSVSTYGEVQLGKVGETVDHHEQDLKEQNEALKDQIALEHEPSLAEGLKATGGAAAVGAALSLTMHVWKKYRDGKNVFAGDFTVEDWKEVGLSTVKGAAGGAFAGGAIYALTNCAEMAAPFAGAFVSAAKGMASLVADYHAGKLSLDALIDNGMFVCSDAAIVGLCTAAGQTLIPVPVLGAVLGSIAGKLLSTFIGKKAREVTDRLAERMSRIVAALDDEVRKVLNFLEEEFDRLGELTTIAFDLSANVRLLDASLALARAHGVHEALLIRNESDLDAFMTGA